MSDIRQQRIAEQIQTIVAELFLRELRDPRLQLVTVTDVTVDRELQMAHIYVNALGNESRQEEVLAALRKASGFMRRVLAHQLHTRTVPQLLFHWDPSQAQADRVYALLDTLDIPPQVVVTDDVVADEEE
ncbi:MAG: 30S ribosome-binding factor RbfA [Chloroflexi bacterium]|nr:30S ribosome-binding factor RbfA [Chloroflexota bacterium]MBP8057400.1 30S ribosome-binding factor RbfA [Chloroflexota bacterium]